MAILDAFTRTAFHYLITVDSQIRTRNTTEDEVGIIMLPEIRDLLVLMNDHIGHSKAYLNGNLILKFRGVEFSDDDQFACVLINAIDKNGSTTVIRDIQNDSRIEAGLDRTREQGYETSFHLAIDLNKKNGVYGATGDKVPKINCNIVRSFFNHVLLQVSKKHENNFTINHRFNAIDPKTNEVIKIRYRPVIQVDYKPDEAFLRDMDKGNISNVRLIREETENFVDVDAHRRIKLTESVIRIDTQTVNGGMRDWLKSVGNFYSPQKYTRIKFNYKNEEGFSGTVSLDTDDLRFDGLETALVKKTLMDGFVNLKDSYDSVHKPIMDKLIEAHR